MNNTYNPSIGSPGVYHVKPYDPASSRDLPKNYAEAREAFERADKRRGGARGKIAHNTTIREVPVVDRAGSNGDGSPAYAVKLHDTDIVTFLPCGSIELDTGGYQTTTTRDRMNRCGVCIGMGGGVASVRHGGTELVYADGMRLKFRRDGTPGMAWYVNTAKPIGSVDDVRARRRRVLARAQREDKAGLQLTVVPFYWPGRQGGYTHKAGNCPEAFGSDFEFGLKKKTRRVANVAQLPAAIRASYKVRETTEEETGVFERWTFDGNTGQAGLQGSYVDPNDPRRSIYFATREEAERAAEYARNAEVNS